MVIVSPSVPVVRVEVEDRGGGISPLCSAVGKMADTVLAVLIAAESVENCEGFLCQFSPVCKPSEGPFGNDEDGR